TLAEGAIRLLEYERKSDFLRKGFVVVATDYKRLRGKDPVSAEQFVQVNFVRAFKNGIRVVDDSQAKRFCFFGKLKRMVIYISRLAYEQGIELNERLEIVTCDDLAIESRLLGG